jgi:branched-chain amino acid transport system ATP-binding protein
MSAPILKTHALTASYGGRAVLNGIDIELRENEVLCLLGHNGAGKSTLVKTLFGLMAPSGGEVLVDGVKRERQSVRASTAAGIALVPEGRGVFPSLTVEEVLRLGLWSADVPVAEHQPRIDWVMQVLPDIKRFYKQRAGSLSGGQQQMVSVGRALLSRPRCLLMDEPSIGLAPKLFQDLLGPIRQLQQETRMSILLVEQNVREALKVCDRVAVMKSGSLIREALPSELDTNAKLMELY